MKVIYMKETIDYMAMKDSRLLFDLEELGVPEPVELLDDRGNVTHTYYLYEIKEERVGDY